MECLCKVCLSGDRKLFEMTTSLSLIMRMILPEVEINKLCWECLASVNHLVKLRKRALKSKEILEKCIKVNKPISPQSSSNLGTCYIFTFSFGDNSQLNIGETKITKNEPKHGNIELDNELGLSKDDLKGRKLNKDVLEVKTNVLKNVRTKQKKVSSTKKRVVSHKQYNCSECKEKFESRGKYEYHRQKHRGRVQCTICSRDFSSRNSLSTHNTTVHSGTPRDDTFKHYCQPCDKFFKTSCSFGKHMRTSAKHIDPALLRFCCPTCGKAFVTSNERDQHHETVHLQKNKLKCARCPRQYCSTRALRSHMMRRHVGAVTKRDYVCEVCGIGFKTAQVLRGHQRTHEKQKSESIKNICNINSEIIIK